LENPKLLRPLESIKNNSLCLSFFQTLPTSFFFAREKPVNAAVHVKLMLLLPADNQPRIPCKQKELVSLVPQTKNVNSENDKLVLDWSIEDKKAKETSPGMYQLPPVEDLQQLTTNTLILAMSFKISWILLELGVPTKRKHLDC
jgi:tRNA pseudouridine-54 N-methylase